MEKRELLELLAEIEDDKIRILILNVGHRSEVYR